MLREHASATRRCACIVCRTSTHTPICTRAVRRHRRIRRCTHEAEKQMTALGIEDWVTIQRRRKWRFAARVMADSHKWGLKALLWDPLLDTRSQAKRRQGRPKMRWTDDINAFITDSRSDNDDTYAAPLYSLSSEMWKQHEEQYVYRSLS